MRKYLFLTCLVINVSLCFADEPPSWTPYRIVSENEEFFCWIDFADNKTSLPSQKRKWALKVYSSDSTLIWKRNFHPSGYSEGSLTNDGNSFVYVDFWYYKNEYVVKIFKRSLNDHFIKGKDFSISPDALEKTVSHRLWRKKYKLEDNKIIIETIDNNVWEVDLINNGLRLINPKNPSEDVKEQNLNYSLSILLGAIVFLLVVLVIYRRKKL